MWPSEPFSINCGPHWTFSFYLQPVVYFLHANAALEWIWVWGPWPLLSKYVIFRWKRAKNNHLWMYFEHITYLHFCVSNFKNIGSKSIQFYFSLSLVTSGPCFVYFPTHDWLSIIWSIKEDNQAPAICNLAWLWHHYHLALNWTGIEPTTFRSWAECSIARP